MADGRTNLTYVYSRVQARPESFIPVVGAFVGGADTYNTSAVLMFDRNGVLVNYIANEGGTGIGKGLSSGSMRPRQDGPVEAAKVGPAPGASPSP